MVIMPERHLRRRAPLPNNIWSKSHVIPKRPWREGSYESAEPAQTHPGVAFCLRYRQFKLSQDPSPAEAGFGMT